MHFRNSFDWQIDMKMSDIELDYKIQYKEGKMENLTVPHMFDPSKDILKHMDKTRRTQFLTSYLEEEYFFEETQDVGLYRHIRYLPAFWHSHSFLEIACVIQGSALNYIGDNVITMQEGDIVILAPDVNHALGVYDDESIVVNIIIRTSSFEQAFFGALSDSDILSEFFRRMLYHSPNHPYLYFQTGVDYELFNFVGYALQEFQGKREYRERLINGIITGFFIILLRKHGAKVILPETDLHIESENIVFLLKYLQENYLTVTLGELAAIFNYSERQIQRIIKETTGMSFRKNILKLRMIQAARLLKSTKMSVSEISENLNYESSTNFRAAFKKYYGITPKEYRTKQDVV